MAERVEATRATVDSVANSSSREHDNFMPDTREYREEIKES